MIGLNGQRVYLDWNATAPLRPEARAAMLAAMDVVGNPSSVHAEGRAAKAIVEKARGQVAALTGCGEPTAVVFTSGATEVNAFVASEFPKLLHSASEHDSIVNNVTASELNIPTLIDGCVDLEVAEQKFHAQSNEARQPIIDGGVSIAAANAEVGSINGISKAFHDWIFGGNCRRGLFHTDATQKIGKQDFDFVSTNAELASCSAHKIGGPKGVGALLHKLDFQTDQLAVMKGGGQEKGRRSGTENVIGIAGFGAAAQAAQRELEAGVWDLVETLRDNLEDALASAAPDAIFFGKESPRLPNTSCFAVPGWKGETQVMQMDLAGFAVSAGSACSSGKVNKASRVLLAMGFDEITASSAIRVSMGPTTTEAEVMAFADAWTEAYRRRKSRAA